MEKVLDAEICNHLPEEGGGAPLLSTSHSRPDRGLSITHGREELVC